MKEFLKEELEDIFSLWGPHPNLTAEQLATELAREWELSEHGKSDLPALDRVDRFMSHVYSGRKK